MVIEAGWEHDDEHRFALSAPSGVIIFVEGSVTTEAANALALALRSVDVSCTFAFSEKAPTPLIVAVGPL